MKKTFPVNINGAVFYIDEDAYELLNNYLDQLRTAFPGREGEEIVADIEGRISEIFAEMCADTHRVVNISDVNLIIEKMGRPADISNAEFSDAEPQPEIADGTVPPPYTGTVPPAPAPGRKRLFRDMQNKVLGGVLSGVAVYLNWNPNILRLLVFILAIFTYVWPLFFCYLIAWMVIPAATTMRQILEMRGEAVTVDSVSQSVLDSIASEPADTRGFFGTVLSGIFKIFMTLLGIVGVCVGLGALFVLIITLCGLIILAGWGTDSMLADIGIFCYSSQWPVMYAIGLLCAALAVLLPCVAAVWGCFASLNGRIRTSRSAVITLAVVEVVLIIGAIVLLNVVANVSVPVVSSIMTGACSMYLA
ncbi:MAG: PspC domain-containing protein [Muribaculaceae bacterium]|nr:PspC domain-containing protein [Muribaculaceae bacterium]